MVKLNASQLRKGTAAEGEPRQGRGYRGQVAGKRNEIYIVLDNVLDTYNIGSIFRLADAVAAKKIFLCGGTETPPNHRIKKASINTTEWVEWEYAESAMQVIKDLRFKIKDLQVVAIEQVPRAVQYNKFEYKLPIALIVGHESNGISKEVLDLADAVVELPMYGVNISLNVMVSLGIVLYRVVATASFDKVIEK